jgi:hypothetical protein
MAIVEKTDALRSMQGLGHSRPDTTRIEMRDASKATAEITMISFGMTNSERGSRTTVDVFDRSN